MNNINKNFCYIGDVPETLHSGDIAIALNYDRCPKGEPFIIEKVDAEEYNPKHATYPYGQPSIMVLERG